jgi:hypothetical protein
MIRIEDPAKYEVHVTRDELETITALRAGTACVVPKSAPDEKLTYRFTYRPGPQPTFSKEGVRKALFGDLKTPALPPKEDLQFCEPTGSPPTKRSLHDEYSSGFLDTYLIAKVQGDTKFLAWLHDRLQFVHGEDANIDYMHTLKRFVKFFAEYGDEIAMAVDDNTSPPTDRFTEYFVRQVEWSLRTFGPDARTNGILSHIDKEQDEIRKAPNDLMEWVDIMILAMDGYHRHGGNPRMLMDLLERKQRKNFARAWPDWRTLTEDDAVEHDRSAE